MWDGGIGNRNISTGTENMTPAETRGEGGGGNITTTWKIWPTEKLGVGGEGGLGILAIEKHNPHRNWQIENMTPTETRM